MRPTEELHHLARINGIVLRRYRLPMDRKGFYLHLHYPPVPHIILSPDLRPGSVEYRAVLAHELGHHFTLAGNFAMAGHSEYERTQENRWEVRAELWAIDFMVRSTSLRSLLKARYETWEIADKLLVPEPWILNKLERMTRSARVP